MADRRCKGTLSAARSDDELPVGRDKQGNLFRIDQAKAKGLACELFCPACNGPLIAYLQTTRKRQHFGHHSRVECRYAYETALHLYAKQLIEQRRELTLPAMVTASGRQLRPQQAVRFDSVQVEQRFHEIIPDIIAIKKDRRLLVEIAVTHPCELRKLRVLAQRAVAAVEIDLSRYRTATDPQLLDQEILETAPRKWAFHRQIEQEDREEAAARQASAERRAAEAEQRIANERKKADNEAARLLIVFERWKQETNEYLGEPTANVPHYADIELCGLDDLIDIDIPGQWILASSPRRWQCDILWSLLMHPQESRRVLHGATVVGLLERKHHLRPELKGLDPGVNAALRRLDPNIPDRITVGHAYVDSLRTAKVLDDDGRFSFEIMQAAFARRQAALDARQAVAEAARQQKEQKEREAVLAEGRRLEQERRSTSRARVDAELHRVLDRLPAHDRDGFDITRWWATPLADGRTPEQRIESERFGDKLADQIAALALLLENGGPPAQDLINLPLHEMREQRDREAAERAELDEVKFSNRRLAEIEHCGASESWLETPLTELDGMTPRLAALKSASYLERARRILFGPYRQTERPFGFDLPGTPSPAHYLQRLRDAATHCYGDRAPMWLETTSHALGGVPITLCDDDRSLQRCLNQLEADTRKKLPKRFRSS